MHYKSEPDMEEEGWGRREVEGGAASFREEGAGARGAYICAGELGGFWATERGN